MAIVKLPAATHGGECVSIEVSQFNRGADGDTVPARGGNGLSSARISTESGSVLRPSLTVSPLKPKCQLLKASLVRQP